MFLLQFLCDTLDADIFSEVAEACTATRDFLHIGFGEPAPLPVRQSDAFHPAWKNITTLRNSNRPPAVVMDWWTSICVWLNRPWSGIYKLAPAYKPNFLWPIWICFENTILLPIAGVQVEVLANREIGLSFTVTCNGLGLKNISLLQC